MRCITAFAMLVLLVSLAGCSGPEPELPAGPRETTPSPELTTPAKEAETTPPEPVSPMLEKIAVVVGAAPQAGFVDVLGGDWVETAVLLPEGQDHQTYEPTPEQVQQAADAKVVCLGILPFETQLAAQLREMGASAIIADIAKGIETRNLAAESGAEPVPDPHVWLSPPLIEVQAKNITEALKQAAPRHEEDFDAYLANFLEEVAATHAKMQEVLAPLKGGTLYVFHPAFGYFGDTYGLKQEVAPGLMAPSAEGSVDDLVAAAREAGVRLMIANPGLSADAAKALGDATGAAVVPLDPMTRDVLRELARIAAEVERAGATE